MNSSGVDLVVVGSGPAGLAAAGVAGHLGINAVVADENSTPGGQLFKQIHKFFGPSGHYAGKRGFDIARELIDNIHSTGVELCLDTVCWGITPQKEVMLADKRRTYNIKAGAVILATGANEKTASFPGWTLPGVMTAGAAQTLANIHGVLPGRRILVLGSGNVGLIVAYQMIQAGAEIVAIVEAAPETGGYEVHAATLLRRGVIIYTGHTIVEARGGERVEEAVIAPVDARWQPVACGRKRLEVDTILLAVGLSPMVELASMAGCRIVYSPGLGGYVPAHDENMATTVPGIYIAGDSAGVEEAGVAMEEGYIAGWTAAVALGRAKPEAEEVFFRQAKRNLASLRSAPRSEKIRLAKADMCKKMLQVSDPCQPDSGPCRNIPASECRKREISDIRRDHLSRGPVAVIECREHIACDPCVAACARGAISMKQGITGLPVLDPQRCNGCGTCAVICPGRAIFIIDASSRGEVGCLTVPFEYRPLPVESQVVDTLDREGHPVGRGTVKKLVFFEKFDHTVLVRLELPKEHLHRVRSFKF